MRRIVILAAVGIALMLPGVALAQGNSTCQTYNPTFCTEVSSNATGTNASSNGTLPFTGLDVVLLAGGGATLLGAGFVVRRVSRRLN